MNKEQLNDRAVSYYQSYFSPGGVLSEERIKSFNEWVNRWVTIDYEYFFQILKDNVVKPTDMNLNEIKNIAYKPKEEYKPFTRPLDPLLQGQGCEDWKEGKWSKRELNEFSSYLENHCKLPDELKKKVMNLGIDMAENELEEANASEVMRMLR